jgi:hypothetical protein
MSVWAAVLGDLAARGGTPGQVAARLGLSTPLVQAILDHAERLGVVAVAGRGCGTQCPTGQQLPPSCVGCPLAGRSLQTSHTTDRRVAPCKT